ncbi:maker247 [Drosophila busckii]|uniref:Maker247 n=1 Tax=Drosophila busckii TaxID=30019 RepID=A0A0M3QYG6_DROBS|nr:maker247 [Drosophila busckii]
MANVMALFAVILILVRYFVKVDHIDAIEYDSVPLNETFPPHPKYKYCLYYAPKSDVLSDLMSITLKSLNMTCIEGYDTKSEMAKAAKEDKVYLAIQFDGDWENENELPNKLSYAIRLSGFFQTKQLYPDTAMPGDRESGDNYISTPPYMSKGFLQLQHAVSMAFIKNKSSVNALPETLIQKYPYSEFSGDAATPIFGPVLPLFLLLGFMFPLGILTAQITNEKQKNLKEMMKLLDVSGWIHWVAWFVQAFLMLLITIIVFLIILKIPKNGLSYYTNSDGFLLFIFFITFAIAVICFCFLLSIFFNKSGTAGVVTSLIVFLSYIPFVMYMTKPNEPWTKLIFCFIPTTALCFGIQASFKLDIIGVGAHWDNLYERIDAEDKLSFGLIMLVMLISAIIYILLCLYLEQVRPGEFGVARKWNFPFTRQFWSCKQKRQEAEDTETEEETVEKRDPNAFEDEPKDKTVGLKVKNLTKKFGKHTAVDRLSIDMYEGEITVLLGHNGAGKTTTLSMLVGMLAPSSGTAIVNGHDIRTNLKDSRMSMGICTQYNILFDALSPANHIRFFSRLKGVKKEKIKSEVDKYIKLMGLEKKANVASKNLSGGMKRKLCVCLAFCGDTKVVLCDEPSSGMDPSARRQLWHLVQMEKAGRTILLTTHFMDEAEVLGDSIAIMSNGVLICKGTSFFLKKQYSSDYVLICIKLEGCQSSKVTQALSNFLPNLKPHSDIGTELMYKLPLVYSDRFEALLSNLEGRLEELKLAGFGISISNMEDVFLKVNADRYHNLNKEQATEENAQQQDENDDKEALNKEQATKENAQQQDENDDKEAMKNNEFLPGTPHTKIHLCLDRWEAMFLKKIFFAWNNKFLILFILIIPMIFMLVTYIGQVTNSVADSKRLITLKHYGYGAVLFDQHGNDATANKIADAYKELISSYGTFNLKDVSDKGIMKHIQNTEQSYVNRHYWAGVSIDNNQIIAWVNAQPLHTAPMSLNLVHNAMAKALISNEAEIKVTNWPLPAKSEVGIIMEVAVNVALITALVTPIFVLFVINERLGRFKHLQFIGGVDIMTFWLTHLIFDFAILLIVSLIIFIWMSFIDYIKEDADKILLTMLVFSFGVLTWTYLLSFWFKGPTAAFLVIFILALLSSIFFTMVLMLMQSLRFLRYFLPHLWLHDSFQELSFKHAEISYSYILIFIAVSLLELGIVLFIDAISVGIVNCRCAAAIKEAPTDLDDDVQHERERVMAMTSSERKEHVLVLDRLSKKFGKKVAVNQLSLCVQHAECFGLLGVNGAGKTTTFSMLTGDKSIDKGDAYVEGMSIKKKLGKVFPKIGYCPQFEALQEDLTGRQTLKFFSLLHGIHKKHIKDLTESLAKSFGFTEHLDKRVCKYSGGNKRKLSTAVAVLGSPTIVYLDEPSTGMDPGARRQLWNMIHKLRESGKSILLTSHSMEECEALCTRLAIMVNGQFKCIGPTQHLKNKFSKGFSLRLKMDPDADQQSSKTDSSMENDSEQEAQRSSKQSERRKSRDARRKSKAANEAPETETRQEDKAKEPQKQTDNDVDKVKEFVSKEFPNAQLQEEYKGILTYYIPLSGMKWSNIFGIIQKNQRKLKIADYSISQTSLEDIFLEFAKSQN